MVIYIYISYKVDRDNEVKMMIQTDNQDLTIGFAIGTNREVE